MSAPTQDWRRHSLLEPELPTRDELLGGLGAAVGISAAVPLLLVGLTAAIGATLEAAGVDPHEALIDPTEEEEVPPPAEVIHARFVMLGSEIDPRRLPDRYRASRATSPPPGEGAQPEAAPPPVAPPAPPPRAPSERGVGPAPAEVAPTGEPTPEAAPTPTEAPRPTRPPGETRPQANAADDPLTRLGDRADALSTLARPREREGDPEGIPEGTERRGDADIYLGQLYTYFRRGWQAPSGLSDAELRALDAVVEVTLTRDARVGAWRISRGSGNEGFDATVRQRMSQAEGAALPTPPADEAERYLGRTISLRFLGRHGR